MTRRKAKLNLFVRVLSPSTIPLQKGIFSRRCSCKRLLFGGKMDPGGQMGEYSCIKVQTPCWYWYPRLFWSKSRVQFIISKFVTCYVNGSMVFTPRHTIQLNRKSRVQPVYNWLVDHLDGLWHSSSLCFQIKIPPETIQDTVYTMALSDPKHFENKWCERLTEMNRKLNNCTS